MKRDIFLILFAYLPLLMMGQGIGINPSGAAPAGDAGLDVNFSDKGLLIPRVSLTNTGTYGLAGGGPTTSMLVYNTNNSIAGTGAAGTGFYFWNGSRWEKLLDYGTPADAWLTTGNAGTTAGTHFIGTTDNINLDFRTNNIIRMRLLGANYQLRAFGNGSATAPFYSWNSDPDIGMYRAGTDILGFATGGTERINIGAYTGSIGIGRTACCGVAGSGPIVDVYQPMEVGNDAGLNLQAYLGYWRGSDVEISPESDGWGYIGYNGTGTAFDNIWYRGYSFNWVSVSDRNYKKNIITIDDNLMKLFINDIIKTPIHLYNYINEYDEIENIDNSKYHFRKQYHIGLIADEAPDYLLDEVFEGVSAYEVASLALLGVKYLLSQQTTQPLIEVGRDSIKSKENEATIHFKNNFKSPPFFFISNFSNSFFAYIKEIHTDHVIIGIKGEGPVVFDWIAISENNDKHNDVTNIPNNILSKLHLTPEDKKIILNYYSTQKRTSEIQK